MIFFLRFWGAQIGAHAWMSMIGYVSQSNREDFEDLGDSRDLILQLRCSCMTTS